MSEIELTLYTALQKAGLLERFMNLAQQAGLSLLGYLERCADESAIKADATAGEAGKTSRSSEEIWAEMMALPMDELTRQLGAVYHECGIADMSGEELRDICRG